MGTVTQGENSMSITTASQLNAALRTGNTAAIEDCLHLYRQRRAALKCYFSESANNFLLSITTQMKFGRGLTPAQLSAAGRCLAEGAVELVAHLNDYRRENAEQYAEMNQAEICTCESYDGEALCPCCSKNPALVQRFKQRHEEALSAARSRCGFYGSW